MLTRRFVVGAAAAYLALAVAYAWPLPRHLATGIAHDAIDPLLNTWILQWTAVRAPWAADWWHPPGFAPMAGALALSEHLLGLWPLSAPLLAIGVPPVAVYNLLLIASFACSALTSAVLVTHLTGSRAAGLVAGCLYGFAPYRLAQLAHLQILAAWWGPVALLALHRQADAGGWRWAVVFAVSWLLLSLTSGYHLAFFTVVAALAGAWLFVRRDRLARAVPLAVATACAGVALVPLLVGYHRVHAREGLTRQPAEIDEYSADAVHLWKAPALSKVWGGPWSDYEETALFPGVALIAGLGLTAAGLMRRDVRAASGELAPAGRRGWQLPHPGWRPASIVAGLGLIPLGLATIAASAPGRYALAGMDISLTRPAKSLTVAWVLFLVAGLVSPPGRRMLARRSPLALYLLLGVFTWVLTLGPRARVGGVTVLYHAPYAWLMAVPGGLAMRVPPRFWLWSVLALAVAVGYGVAALQRRAPRAGGAAAAALCVLALAEGWPREMPVAALPREAHPLAGTLAPGALWVELPLGPSDVDMQAIWRGSALGRRVVNGYSGYDPVHYRLLERGIKDGEAGLLQVLAEPSGLLIAVDRRSPDADRFAALAASEGATVVGTERDWQLFRLPSRPPLVGPAGRRVHPVRVTDLDGTDVTAATTDADRFSRWYTPHAQRAGDGLVVDLPDAAELTAIELGLGAFPLDYPVRLRVEADTAGGPAIVFEGGTAANALRASLVSPSDPVIVLPLRPVRTQRLRLVLSDGHPSSAWTVSAVATLAR